jgi:heme o synthase
VSSASEALPSRRTSLGDWWTLAKPGITALICLVAVGGFLLADPTHVDLVRLGLVVGFGALASAGSGMLNHYLERDRDRAMRRTRSRPLAAARVDPRTTAVVGLACVG